MKKSLLLISMSILLLALYTCRSNKVNETTTTDQVDSNAQEIKHYAPDQARFDSIKAAKTQQKKQQ